MEHTTVEHKLMINILHTEMDAALFFANTGQTWCSLFLETHLMVQVSLWKIPQRELWSPSTLPSQWEHFHLNNTSNMNRDIFCVSSCQHTTLQLQHEYNSVPNLTHPTTQIKCLIVESSLQVPWWADYAITSHVIKKRQKVKQSCSVQLRGIHVMQVVNTSPHHISCQPLQPWTWPLLTGSPMHPYALHLPGLWIQESYELCTKQRNKTHHLITAQVYIMNWKAEQIWRSYLSQSKLCNCQVHTQISAAKRLDKHKN